MEPQPPALPERDERDLAAWERPGVFSPRPSSAELGYIAHDDKVIEVDSREEIAEALIGRGKGSVAQVFTAKGDYCRPPEDYPWLGAAILRRQQLIAAHISDNAKRNAVIFGAIFAFSLFSRLRDGLTLEAAFNDQFMIMSGLLLAMFGLLPLYEAWKFRRNTATLTAETVRERLAPDARFDRWLGQRKAALTMIATGLIGIAFAVQFYISGRAANPNLAIEGVLEAGGLIKERLAAGTEWWRLATAPFLHGGLLHFFFNASALWFLGKRVEVLSRWVHVFPVLVISGLFGGLFSYWARSIYILPSIGASGAIVGLLGFLLVFETLHPRLCPRSARRRLMAILLSLVVIGVIGIKMVDNAAHLGGLLSGMAYAAIIFPKSSSPHRPRATFGDKIFAIGSSLIILAAFALTISRLLQLRF